MLELADCYLHGEGVAENKTDAFEWIKKAAEKGDADAMFYLARCYFEGEGVTEDKPEAVKWWKKAADQGDADSMFELANCYFNGDGVDGKDVSKAVALYKDAAQHGSEEALETLRELAEKNDSEAQAALESLSLQAEPK